MDEMILLVVLGLLGTVLWLGACLIWAGWIRDYITGFGEKLTRSRLLFWAADPLSDYFTARRIAKLTGYTPWFLKSFVYLALAGLLSVLAGVIAQLLIDLR